MPALQEDLIVEGSSTPEGTLKKRKVRGPTRLDYCNVEKAKKLGFKFNERGQLVGRGYVKVSTFIGTSARELVPVTYKDWDSVPKTIINGMWGIVKQKFDIDEIHKDYIISLARACWRQYRCALTSKLKKIKAGPDRTRLVRLLKPNNVHNQEDWTEFVRFRCSEDFKKISDKYKELKAKNTLPHSTSRKGYARLEDELNQKSEITSTRVDVWVAAHTRKNGEPTNDVAAKKLQELDIVNQLPTMDDDTSIRNDSIVKVLGPDPRGRIRGLGHGASLKKVEAQTLSRANTIDLKKDVKNLTSRVEDLTNIIQVLLQNRNPSRNENDDEIQSSDYETRGKEPEDTLSRKARKVVENESLESSQVQIGQMFSNTQVRACKLLHWLGTNEVVAESTIESKDPCALVHHMIIGPDCWKVWVNRVRANNIPLFRATSEFHFLEDAIGSTIAWPTKYITFDGV